MKEILNWSTGYQVRCTLSDCNSELMLPQNKNKNRISSNTLLISSNTLHVDVAIVDLKHSPPNFKTRSFYEINVQQLINTSPCTDEEEQTAL